MTLKAATYLLAVLAGAGAAAETNHKPSPVHYKSSTAPARRMQNKSPAPSNAIAPESSRNRMTASSDLPLAKMVDNIQSGIACFYGAKTPDAGVANPEQDDPKLTAAHAFLPFGSQVQVTNLANGRSIKVMVTDRIPEGERIISISRRAAERLGFVNAGTARVKLELLSETSRM